MSKLRLRRSTSQVLQLPQAAAANSGRALVADALAAIRAIAHGKEETRAIRLALLDALAAVEDE